jgi:hypothetical protein
MCLTQWVDIVAILIAIGALIFTGLNFRTQKKQLRLQVFSELLKQIASDKARNDRRLVYEIAIIEGQTDKNIETVKELIKSVQKDIKGDEKKKGTAVERTIATLDRVGFFLFSDTKKQKPKTRPPLWLWEIVNEMWARLGDWVVHKQKEKPGYGYYFKKLAESRYNGKYWAK